MAAFADPSGSSTAYSSTPRWCTRRGGQEISNFLFGVWGAAHLDAAALIEPVEADRVGSDERVLCALGRGGLGGGGALVHKAIGDRLTCVFVDHGVLREARGRQSWSDF